MEINNYEDAMFGKWLISFKILMSVDETVSKWSTIYLPMASKIIKIYSSCTSYD